MRRLAGWAALGLAVTALAAGCGNRSGSLTGYLPEGQPNQGVLAVQVDTVKGGASLHATALVYLQVPANRVRLYDNVDNRGFIPADGLSEAERTSSTNWSTFRIPIQGYDPTATHALIARGSRDGVENVLSPRTNMAAIPAGDLLTLTCPRDTIPLAPRATQLHFDAPPAIPIDSLYLHIGTVAQAQRIFIEIVKGAVTQYLTVYDRQPNNSFARSYVFEDIPPDTIQTYSWHVDEYDGQSRLIAGTASEQGNGGFIFKRPKVAGAPFVWPTDNVHVRFDPWTIPGASLRRRPPER